MQTYTVYEKRVPPEDLEERASELIFVKEGFAVFALLFTPIWLIAYGLWRELLLYILLIVAVSMGLTQLGANEEVIGWGNTLINLIFAFEARDLYRGALERRGYVLRAVVSGRNLPECERRYLMEWLPHAKRDRERAAEAAAANAAGTSGEGKDPTPAPVPIIGMFPSHGG